jgi:hypothetical protein
MSVFAAFLYFIRQEILLEGRVELGLKESEKQVEKVYGERVWGSGQSNSRHRELGEPTAHWYRTRKTFSGLSNGSRKNADQRTNRYTTAVRQGEMGLEEKSKIGETDPLRGQYSQHEYGEETGGSKPTVEDKRCPPVEDMLVLAIQFCVLNGYVWEGGPVCAGIAGHHGGTHTGVVECQLTLSGVANLKKEQLPYIVYRHPRDVQLDELELGVPQDPVPVLSRIHDTSSSSPGLSPSLQRRHPTSTNMPSTIYKYDIQLFCCLYSLIRILPAWKYSRRRNGAVNRFPSGPHPAVSIPRFSLASSAQSARGST